MRMLCIFMCIYICICTSMCMYLRLSLCLCALSRCKLSRLLCCATVLVNALGTGSQSYGPAISGGDSGFLLAWLLERFEAREQGTHALLEIGNVAQCRVAGIKVGKWMGHART